MKHDIAFLHTSPVHVSTFEALMREVAPGLRATHRVREDLLADARREGVNAPGLVARIESAMAQAHAGGAQVVMCTCSTIGGVAEAMDTKGAFTAARIDRAMADEAVRGGCKVLVVAALESTLRPTLDLLGGSAAHLGTEPAIETLVVRGAWAHFEAGDLRRYIDSIVQAVAQAKSSNAVVVLAQASMAPASGQLEKLGIRALSSPRPGVERAVAMLAGAPPGPRSAGT